MVESRVLVLDDDPALVEVIPHIITRQLSVAVETTTRPSAALACLARDAYAALITDFSLPECDGLRLLPKLKDAAPTTPIIVMTGVPDLEVAEQAFQHGAFDFLSKPFERDVLVTAVRYAIRAHRVAERLIRQEALVAGLRQRLERLERRVAQSKTSSDRGMQGPHPTRAIMDSAVGTLTKTIVQAEGIRDFLAAECRRYQAEVAAAETAAEERARARLRQRFAPRASCSLPLRGTSLWNG